MNLRHFRVFSPVLAGASPKFVPLVPGRMPSYTLPEEEALLAPVTRAALQASQLGRVANQRAAAESDTNESVEGLAFSGEAADGWSWACVWAEVK